MGFNYMMMVIRYHQIPVVSYHQLSISVDDVTPQLLANLKIQLLLILLCWVHRLSSPQTASSVPVSVIGVIQAMKHLAIWGLRPNRCQVSLKVAGVVKPDNISRHKLHPVPLKPGSIGQINLYLKRQN